jgi:hypothetical protein
MSEYAVHFTKASPPLSAYDAMLSILWDGMINPTGPLGAARNLEELGASQWSACFSEIPLDLLVRLIDRRSLYGIGFREDFLVDQGGARVWYLDKDGPAAESFTETVREAMTGGLDPQEPIWHITPFVDFPGDYGGTQYRFEWEREWRVPGGLHFQPDDVAFLFIPESFHTQARSYFEGHLHENSGPAYLCPYVDPTWEMNQIQAAFESLAQPVAVGGGPTSEFCEHCGGPTVGGLCMLCGQQNM